MELTLLYLGTTRDENGECLGFGIGAKYYVADTAVQITLSLVGFIWFLSIAFIARKQNKLGNNTATYTIALGTGTMLMFLLNRTVVMVKIFTPEDYDSCCNFVLNEPRKFHRLRYVEITFLLAGGVLALLTLVNVALSWLDTALKTAKLNMSGKSQVKNLRRFYNGLEVVSVITIIILLFVNVGFSSFIVILAYIIIVASFVYSERKIYPLLSTLKSSEGGVSSSYGVLLHQIRVTTYSIAVLGLVLLTGAAIYLYTNLAGNRDWKDFTPPDEISLNLLGNAWISLGWELVTLPIAWFLWKRNKAASTVKDSAPSPNDDKSSFAFTKDVSNTTFQQKDFSAEDYL